MKQVESLLSTLGLIRLISLRLKNLRQRLPRIRVIVDYQNPSPVEQLILHIFIPFCSRPLKWGINHASLD